MDVEDLLRELEDFQRLFLDTMVFVYALENHPRFGPFSLAVLARIESGVCQGITSALTLAELLTAPAQAQDDAALHDYELYLTNFPNLQICPFQSRHASLVARIRAQTKLRTPDAIQLAIAHTAGCDVIISNDKQWSGKTASLRLIGFDGL